MPTRNNIILRKRVIPKRAQLLDGHGSVMRAKFCQM